MDITIEHLKTLSGSPAMSIAVAGWKDLIDRGLMEENTFLLGWDNQVIVARCPSGQIVGVLIYADIVWQQKLQVVLGYVVPRFRNNGVYRQLWQALILQAQELGWLRIEGATHTRNVWMKAVMRQLRREPSHIIYQFSVPSKTEGAPGKEPCDQPSTH